MEKDKNVNIQNRAYAVLLQQCILYLCNLGKKNQLYSQFSWPLLQMAQAQKSADRDAVLKVMHDQEEAWNRYDLDGFMQGYWQNDSLRFVSRKGITYGWKEVLDNYRKAYPDMTRTGHLKFTISHIDGLGKDAMMVTGALGSNGGNRGEHKAFLP